MKLKCILVVIIMIVSSLMCAAPVYAADEPSHLMGSGGDVHTAFIMPDGSLWTCGNNRMGQLGDGSTTDRNSPVKVMDDVVSVSVSVYGTYVIKTDGSLWICGYDVDGLMFDVGSEGQNQSVPRYSVDYIKIMDNVAEVEARNGFAMVIKKDGSLWAWGRNDYGQLGDGTAIDRVNPHKVMDGVTAVSTGWNHTLAVKTDGSLWAWGGNAFAKLGDGTGTSRLAPVKIMDDVKAATAGNQHSAALKTDGSLWVWGANYAGQLGDGTKNNRGAPTKFTDGAAAVSAHGNTTAVIMEDGSLWAWGEYALTDDGGNVNMMNDRLLAVKEMDGAAALAVDHYHILAVKDDNSLWALGSNRWGQFGDGTNGLYNIPKKVADGIFAIADIAPQGFTGASEIGQKPLGEQSGADQKPVPEQGGAKPDLEISAELGSRLLYGLSDWAEDEVYGLYERNIIPEDLLYDFSKSIRRDEFTAILINIYEYADSTIYAYGSSFTDIGDSLYKGAIEKAWTEGLVDGISRTEFLPDALLTREQTAKLLYTLISKISGVAPTQSNMPSFIDADSISDWALPYVAYCQENDIMVGGITGEFNPQDNLTREQAMVVAERVITQYKWN